jgi:hypothetical protein
VSIRFITLDGASRETYRAGVAELEASASYPLGSDRFRIDHGEDYFAFFERMGDLRYEVALDGDRVVAVGAGILRPRVPFGENQKSAWYLCDLKVHPEYRGRRIPFAIARRAIPSGYVRCPRGYAISMNPSGRDNAVVALLQRWRLVPLRASPILLVYSLEAGAMREVSPLIERYRGTRPSYLSLGGVKDIVLESTARPMPLLHAQFGPFAVRGAPEPIDGSVHMFATPSGDPLALELAKRGVEPSASATVVQHGMSQCDFSFVLTSEI